MKKKSSFFSAILLTASIVGFSSPARSADKNGVTETPPSIAALSKCKAITDNAQRLSCYDDAVTALNAAITTNNLYVVDKASVRKARSSLFGLRLPSLGLFSEDTADTNSVSQLDGIVATAVQEGYGNWRVTLQDGSVWVQTDDLPLGSSPKPSDKVTIKRGMMASYKMSINGRPAVRVKRVS